MTDEQNTEFETWWEKYGQYCRSGGGEYEKSFSYATWEHCTEQAHSTIAAPQVIEIETTPIHIDFESTAAKYRTDIIGALDDAGAPMCHEDGQLMSAVEQINWLAAKSVAAPAENAGAQNTSNQAADRANACSEAGTTAPAQEAVATFKRWSKGGTGEHVSVTWLNGEDSMPDEGSLYRAPASTATPVVPEGFVRHPVEQVTIWADMYTREGGHALIVQMLRTYAAMLAAEPKPDA